MYNFSRYLLENPPRCTYVRMCVFMSVCLSVCLPVSLSVCMYVCVHVCTCMCVYRVDVRMDGWMYGYGCIDLWMDRCLFVVSVVLICAYLCT